MSVNNRFRRWDLQLSPLATIVFLGAVLAFVVIGLVAA